MGRSILNSSIADKERVYKVLEERVKAHKELEAQNGNVMTFILAMTTFIVIYFCILLFGGAK